MPTGHEENEDRTVRRARNEVFRRETNELLERDALRSLQRTFDCICECSRSGCMTRLALSPAEYENVRAHGDRFVVAPGHEDLTIEVVVDVSDGYVVVEKHGEAGEVARSADPR